MKKFISAVMALVLVLMSLGSFAVNAVSDVGLSEDVALKIKEAYIELVRDDPSRYEGDASALTVEDIEINLYLGNFDGYDIVLVYFAGVEHSGPRIPGTLGPYIFTVAHESIFDNIFAYKDGELTYIKIAERNMLSEESIYNIIYPTYYYGYWTPTFIEANIYDVQPDLYYTDAVEFVYRHGIMVGTSETTFSPEDIYTRGTLVTTLWRIAGEPEATAAAPFEDLTQDWYIPAVNWAYEVGIIKGTSDTTFSPDKYSSRSELVTMMHRFSVYRGNDNGKREDLSVFYDESEIPEYALDALEWAVANGIIIGEDGYVDTDPPICYPDVASTASAEAERSIINVRRIKPLAAAKRAELATVLMRVCVNVEGMSY